MLSTLHIENIAVIEQAEISFDRGFNVLTGETGAGKSIVIDAISAILGERASREMIRTGAQKAFVSAIFPGVPDLPWFAENQVPYEPELGISREIFADGKNSCRVGGKPVTVSTLRRLGVQLIQIHGQNDSQQLFDEATHIGYLDLFAHDEALLESYRQAYDKVSAVRQEIRRLSMDESEKLRLVETLKFQIDEIERAELQPGEEEELLERRKVLQNAEKLTDAIESAVAALYGDESSDGASAMIANAAHALEKVSRVSDEMRALSGKLNDLMYTAQDIADELRDKKDDLTYSADELEQIEERLDTLHKLKRKYGGSVEDVLAFLEKAKRQLDEVEFATDRIEQLQKKLSGLQKTLLEQGTALTEARKAAAQRLQREISSELMQLDMPKIRFVCEFSEQTPQENGLDAVRFLMSANVGEALRPLSKVASGGELARIMLAMKNVLAAEEALNSARAAASSAENEEKDQKQTLIRMLGWRYDADPAIQKVPEPDLARIASYDPAADISKAIENNVTLYDTRMASSSSQGGAVAKARTIKDQENEVRTSLDLLYKDVLQKQAAYEAARTKFAADGADKAAADRKTALGMMSRQEYLTAESAYLAAEAEFTEASLALTGAMEEYEWAVKGMMELASGVQSQGQGAM